MDHCGRMAVTQLFTYGVIRSFCIHLECIEENVT